MKHNFKPQDAPSFAKLYQRCTFLHWTLCPTMHLSLPSLEPYNVSFVLYQCAYLCQVLGPAMAGAPSLTTRPLWVIFTHQRLSRAVEKPETGSLNLEVLPFLEQKRETRSGRVCRNYRIFWLPIGFSHYRFLSVFSLFQSSHLRKSYKPESENSAILREKWEAGSWKLQVEPNSLGFHRPANWTALSSSEKHVIH